MSIVDETMNLVAKRDPNQPEFHQAVQEVVESLEPVLDRHRELRDANRRASRRARTHHSVSRTLD